MLSNGAVMQIKGHECLKVLRDHLAEHVLERLGRAGSSSSAGTNTLEDTRVAFHLRFRRQPLVRRLLDTRKRAICEGHHLRIPCQTIEAIDDHVLPMRFPSQRVGSLEAEDDALSSGRRWLHCRGVERSGALALLGVFPCAVLHQVRRLRHTSPLLLLGSEAPRRVELERISPLKLLLCPSCALPLHLHTILKLTLRRGELGLGLPSRRGEGGELLCLRFVKLLPPLLCHRALRLFLRGRARQKVGIDAPLAAGAAVDNNEGGEEN